MPIGAPRRNRAVRRDKVVSEIFHPARHSRVKRPYVLLMIPIDPSAARELLEAFIAAFAVLGGAMAYFSGIAAFSALARNRPPATVAHEINEGIGAGFGLGAPAAILALMIMGWSW
jgi:hypothetical protein